MMSDKVEMGLEPKAFRHSSSSIIPQHFAPEAPVETICR